MSARRYRSGQRTVCAKTWICEQVRHNCQTIIIRHTQSLKEVKGEAEELGRVQISRGSLHRARRKTRVLGNESFLNRESGGDRLC